MKANEALSHSTVQEPLSIKRKIPIVAILLVYFFSITVWICKPGPLRSALLSLVKPMAAPLAIFQSWSIFGPIPREVNYHETAVITFQDGSVKLYEFPRMQKLNYFQRFRSEKYRKVFFDCMPWGEFSSFLPDFARFLNLANYEPQNQPKMISLVHNWCYIPTPDPQHWFNRDQLPEHTNQMTYFVYSCQTKEAR